MELVIELDHRAQYSAQEVDALLASLGVRVVYASPYREPRNAEGIVASLGDFDTQTEARKALRRAIRERCREERQHYRAMRQASRYRF